MTPVYKKTFDSPLLIRLENIIRMNTDTLQSVDLTKEEFNELYDMFSDKEYFDKKFEPIHDQLMFDNVIITVNQESGITYINKLTSV